MDLSIGRFSSGAGGRLPSPGGELGLRGPPPPPPPPPGGRGPGEGARKRQEEEEDEGGRSFFLISSRTFHLGSSHREERISQMVRMSPWVLIVRLERDGERDGTPSRSLLSSRS